MENKANRILMVPHDFSEASNRALEFSAILSKQTNLNLGILNISDAGTLSYLKNKGLSISNLEEELKKTAEDIAEKHNIETVYFIKPASIKNIGKIAFEHNACLISIGLDKPKAGATRIMQMIAKSPVPVFVGYNKPVEPINDIVFPLDATEESRQKTDIAARIALATKATIHIYSINMEQQTEDVSFAHNLIVKQIEKYFAEQWIKTKTIYAPNDNKIFGSHYIDYATSINAGLIIIMRQSTSFFSSIIWKANDKATFFNPGKIPSLIVNPKVFHAH